MLIEFDGTDLLIGVGILCILLPVLWRRKRNFSYLFFFSLFWAYLLAVAAVVIFPFAINTNQAGIAFTPSVNLIPFYFDSCFLLLNLCVRRIIENIVLTIPFGFGINFLVKIKPKNIPWLALAVGLAFEFSQFFISFIFKSGFRSTDINDVILNGAGVLIGYALFRLFVWAYLNVTEHFNFKHRLIFADIYNIALETQASDRPKST